MSINPNLRAPFPWFGGKSRVAAEIWRRFGCVKNYVEPFFGSGAVLLARPGGASGVETVNDLDGFVSNFWRAVKLAHDEVVRWADFPVSERDLHARHYWLITEGRERLRAIDGDPDGYDAQVAGWWVWGISATIGGGWCSGSDGPWQWDGNDWVKKTCSGEGISRRRPHLGNAGQGIHGKTMNAADLISALSVRLRRVRVCNGDWARVCTPNVTHRQGMTAVFLDPPYTNSERAKGIYAEDDGTVASACREWAIDAGKNPNMRICLAGYAGEHEMPDDWTEFAWKAPGGMANIGNKRGRENASRERLWFSPGCLAVGEHAGFEMEAQQ